MQRARSEKKCVLQPEIVTGDVAVAEEAERFGLAHLDAHLGQHFLELLEIDRAGAVEVELLEHLLGRLLVHEVLDEVIALLLRLRGGFGRLLLRLVLLVEEVHGLLRSVVGQSPPPSSRLFLLALHVS